MTPDPTFPEALGIRTRTFAALLDNILDHETPDQRWLRNAAQRLRDNPEIYEENNDGE